MDRTPTIYIAGPMRGYEDGNFPAFDRQATVLEEQGWRVINPADWEMSRGAKCEWHLAKALGLEIFYEAPLPATQKH